MAKNTKAVVEQLVKPIIESLGYEYVETEFAKQGKDYLLTIYIDSDAGIDLNDCEKVSRAIDPVIDEADPIEQAYCLCVSSLGLDRPLKTQQDFERAMHSCVDVKLFKNLNGKKLITGRLTGFEDPVVIMEDADGNPLRIDQKDIAKITMHVDF